MFSVYEVETGRLVSETSLPVDPTTLRAGLAVVETPEAQLPPARQWDAALRAYVPASPPTRTRLTKLEMTRRFSLAENIALTAVQLDAATDAQTRATLSVLADMKRDADYVDLADPDTRLGVQFAVQVLVGAGVLAAADAATRIAAVLAPIVEV